MALTKRYVTAAGAGDGTGTNSDFTNAMTWAQMITDLNTPRAGYKYIVRGAGGESYANGTTTTTLTGDGTDTSPNVIEGCNTTEGDLYANGRDSNGALVTTNFPVISYTGTTAKFNASGANNLVIACLRLTAAANTSTLAIGNGACVVSCELVSTGTNAASYPVAVSNVTNISIVNCDITTVVSTVTAAVSISGTSIDYMILSNRIKCVNGSGVATSQRGEIDGNTIYECTDGISFTSTTATVTFTNNTIVNCTGDGIDIISTATGSIRVIGNHITGSGGYGVNLNAAVCEKMFGWNRFRDNSSGNISVTDDWVEATSVLNITSDPGGGSVAANDALEFTGPSNDNYSLLTTAAAVVAGVGYRNPIGAHGPGSFGSSASGVKVHPGMSGGMK